MSIEAPERIWLQRRSERWVDDWTWCRDRVDGGDVEYVRWDAVVELLEDHITAMEQMLGEQSASEVLVRHYLAEQP